MTRRSTRQRGFREDPEAFAVAAASKARFDAVMKAAAKQGLLGEKSSRIGGRISPVLVEQAKKQTGIERDSDLIEFALAMLALKDDFPEVAKRSRGKVDPDLKLEY
jgi:hypothetical protein